MGEGIIREELLYDATLVSCCNDDCDDHSEDDDDLSPDVAAGGYCGTF